MKAIITTTATGDIKSKIVNKQICMLSFDVYITPSEFAKLIEEFEGKEFELTIGK